MQSTWRVTTWRGVPIYLHWTVLLGLPWFYYELRDLAGMTVDFAAFLLLLCIHELGHAAVAKWRRVRVIEIRLYLIHGHCRHEEPYHRSDAVWIAWGGVAAQFILFAIVWSARGLMQAGGFEPTPIAALALHVLTGVNFFLIIANLMPVPSFDGALAWQAIPMLWHHLPKSPLEHWKRNRELKRRSKKVTADIIDKFKKRQ